VTTIFRQYGDGPVTRYLLRGGTVGFDQPDALDPDGSAAKTMHAARANATATGSVGGTYVGSAGGANCRIAAQWYRAELHPAAQPVDSTFLLAPPVRFHLSGEEHMVVTSAYLPARYGTLPEHVVIYYTGRTHWSQVGIPGDETAFGVGRVQHDDDDQKTLYEPVSAQQTYTQAIATFAAQLAAGSNA
jgi:hypothetical protein